MTPNAICFPKLYLASKIYVIDFVPNTVALKKKQIKIIMQKNISFIAGYFIWSGKDIPLLEL